MEIHLLDMGTEKYGDCILIVKAGRVILIDGAHPGDESFIKSQLKKLLKKNPPYSIDLLVVTHCHSDHVGCLPAMVAMNYIKPKMALLADPKLRWGNQDGSEDGFFSDSNILAQALQEEDRADMNEEELEKFMSDAVDVLPDYKQMIKQLNDNGAEVIFYRGIEEDYSDLENEFKDFGLQILGPTKQHLNICFENLNRETDSVSDFMKSVDANISLTQAYRQMTQQIVSDADEEGLQDGRNNGAAVNDQSIVIKLSSDGWTTLLAGDMQWASTGVPGLSPHMKNLLLEINKNGPYDFIKLTHHTALNGLNKTILDNWIINTTKLYAHTGGSEDKGHPNKAVLELLKTKTEDIIFGRTDSNGIITIGKDDDGELKMWISKGDFNDFRANKLGDETAPQKIPQKEVALPLTPSVPVSQSPSVTEKSGVDGVVEVTAKIPNSLTRVIITIDIDPQKKNSEGPLINPSDPRRLSHSGGRLDNLLFVTSTAALKLNIGEAEAIKVVQWVKAIPGSKLIELPHISLAKQAAALVVDQITSFTKGVVIIGGYDVVPSSQLDVLDPALRRELNEDGYEGYDADNFIVWSDDIYGDLEGDSLPEIPVSRIPDGKSAELIFNALNAPHFTRNFKFGIRNLARPFAIDIYDTIPADTSYNLEVSEKCSPTNIEVNRAQGAVYYMLHGADHDATRFWGETKGGNVYEAFDINNIPDSTPGTIIFAGCCWGALTVQPAAYRYTPSIRLRPRNPEQSIALSYLKAGALAYIGCTGTHYSPQQPPFNFFGKPMHDLFWKEIKEGFPPALALFQAKQKYASDIPHGRDKSFSKAIEVKILREFTCLGLGW